jgi:hypothetical protein
MSEFLPDIPSKLHEQKRNVPPVFLFLDPGRHASVAKHAASWIEASNSAIASSRGFAPRFPLPWDADADGLSFHVTVSDDEHRVDFHLLGTRILLQAPGQKPTAGPLGEDVFAKVLNQEFIFIIKRR